MHSLCNRRARGFCAIQNGSIVMNKYTCKCECVLYAYNYSEVTATDIKRSNANQYLIELEDEGVLKLNRIGEHNAKFRKIADMQKAEKYLKSIKNQAA